MSSAPPGAVTPTYITVNSTVHVNIDGNSIESDQMGIPGIHSLPPLTGLVSATSCTVTNTSIAGQTWADMGTAISDVQATYVSGKTNILVCKETRNTMANGTTSVATCLGLIHDYATALFAGHADWVVAYMESIPSDGVPTATWNALMFEVDTYVRNHLTEFGFRKFIRLRDISTFSGDGLSQQGFMTSISNCLESSPPYVHPRGSARESEAARIARDLQLIPA